MNAMGGIIDIVVSVLKPGTETLESRYGELKVFFDELKILSQEQFLVNRGQYDEGAGPDDRVLAYKARNKKSLGRLPKHFHTYHTNAARMDSVLSERISTDDWLTYYSDEASLEHQLYTVAKILNLNPALTGQFGVIKMGQWSYDLDGNPACDKKLTIGYEIAMREIRTGLYQEKLSELGINEHTHPAIFEKLNKSDLTNAEFNVSVIEPLKVHLKSLIDAADDKVKFDKCVNLYRLIQFMDVHNVYSGQTLRQDGEHLRHY